MIDSYSYPRLKGLVAAATDCLKAIASKNEAESRRVHALTLTDEERGAIRNVLHHIATKADYLQREDYHLRSLLERTNTQNDAVPAADGEGTRHQEGSRVRASATPTGNTQEPVAWAVRKKNPPVGEAPVLCWCESEMRSVEKSLPGCTVIPLYRHPQPALTDKEREAIKEAVLGYSENDDDEECAKIAATLHGLLKRLG